MEGEGDRVNLDYEREIREKKNRGKMIRINWKYSELVVPR